MLSHPLSRMPYNGLGDRLSQTVGAQTTNYTLDLHAGLTQVLDEGTNSYAFDPSTPFGSGGLQTRMMSHLIMTTAAEEPR